MKFTYDAYENLIHLIQKSGYTITNYHNYMQAENACILRHDVDMDLEKAEQFAEFEANIGECRITSTYFILISSDLYNPFSKKNTECLKHIIKNGHEIGLHFDEKKYMAEENFDKELLIESCMREINLLSNMIEAPVTCVSMHRPSKRFLEDNIELDGIVNSYSGTFFRSFKYVSDSRMCWRENVETIVSAKKEQALHILTHPIWYAKEENTIHTIMKNFVYDALSDRYNSVCDNIRDFQQILGPGDVL